MKVHILMWGGGDEPEDPAHSLHRTKAGALKQARDWLSSGIQDPKEVTRVIKDLRNTGTAWSIEGTHDSFMRLYTEQVNL